MRKENGAEYQIDIPLNDATIMDDNLDIDIEGRFREHPDIEWNEVMFTPGIDMANNSLIG